MSRVKAGEAGVHRAAMAGIHGSVRLRVHSLTDTRADVVFTGDLDAQTKALLQSAILLGMTMQTVENGCGTQAKEAGTLRVRFVVVFARLISPLYRIFPR